jgi:hypothetical protein
MMSASIWTLVLTLSACSLPAMQVAPELAGGAQQPFEGETFFSGGARPFRSLPRGEQVAVIEAKRAALTADPAEKARLLQRARELRKR